MTKTKAQLRAEAVERLRELDAYVDGPESIVDKLVGEIETDRFNYHVEIEHIIDLLTDDEPQDERDTREKLESDIEDFISVSPITEYSPVDVDYWRVRAWLDRQAAITERECREYEDALREQHHKRIAGLKADNDCLRDRNEKLDYEVRDWKGEAKTQRNNFEQATEARKHWQRKYESVKAERAELQAQVDALEAENARLRSRMSDDAEYGRLVMDAYRELRAKLDEIAKVVER